MDNTESYFSSALLPTVRTSSPHPSKNLDITAVLKFCLFIFHYRKQNMFKDVPTTTTLWVHYLDRKCLHVYRIICC